MTTSVRNRTKPSRAVMATAPEVSDAEREPIPGDPTEDTGERCQVCRGHGLVRKVGKNAGKPYRTTNGAQAALAADRAQDCPGCKGLGVIERAPF